MDVECAPHHCCAHAPVDRKSVQQQSGGDTIQRNESHIHRNNSSDRRIVDPSSFDKHTEEVFFAFFFFIWPGSWQAGATI